MGSAGRGGAISGGGGAGSGGDGSGGDASSTGGGAGASAGHAGASSMGGAGASAGGPAGHGGHGGGPASDCTARVTLAEQKLEAAQACNLAQDARTCSGFVSDECGCKVAVNNPNSPETKDYLAAIDALGDCVACTAARCTQPLEAVCGATSGGLTMGRCESLGLTTF
jgi:hypothetical protein